MRRRPGFTLLEVLLAMALTALVLGAVYSFIGYQLKQASAGRELVERATLARAILNRLDGDLRAAITLNDPGRFRLAGNSTSTSGGSGAGSSSSSGSSTAGPSSAGSSSSGSPAPAASSGTGTGSSAAAAGSSSSSGGSGSSSSPAPSLISPIQLPLAVVGTSTSLHLFLSRVPTDALPSPSGDPGLLSCDLRRVSYWVTEGGLYRMELPQVTGDEAIDTEPPAGDNEQYLFAPEVRDVEFSYFDGSSWNDSWDSTMPGPDSTTPQGSPRAIAIRVGVQQPHARDGALKYYRHVVHLLTANGTPLNQNAEGGANLTP